MLIEQLRLEAPPVPTSVFRERVQLRREVPERWIRGTHLSGVCPGDRGVPAPGALEAESVVVFARGEVLREGNDYLLEPVWGGLGLPPGSQLDPGEVVEVDYRFSELRLDLVVRAEDGSLSVRPGASALTAPRPPAARPREEPMGHVFYPYASSGRGPELLMIEEAGIEAATGSTPGRIPRTMAKLAAGSPVKIVCWGDSVTVGGEASPGKDYVSLFSSRLRGRFPSAVHQVERVAVGGSASVHWLFPDEYVHPNPAMASRCDWAEVAASEPDLISIEFVNDAALSADVLERAYGEALGRIAVLGAEAVLITPHFTTIDMGLHDLRAQETRPYVDLLRAFSDRYGVALADASARWGHLWKEGIPYLTLLKNGINHPDDRGHELFAQELMKCFAASS